MEIKFAENLRSLMAERNLSQKKLAKIIGVKQSTVGCWCNGIYLPSVYSLWHLCEILGVSCDGLLGLECTTENL